MLPGKALPSIGTRQTKHLIVQIRRSLKRDLHVDTLTCPYPNH